MFNEVPVAVRPQNNFNNHNMKIYKSNDSNLNDSRKFLENEKRYSSKFLKNEKRYSSKFLKNEKRYSGMLLVFLERQTSVMKSYCLSDISPSRTHNCRDRSSGYRLCYVTEQYVPRIGYLKERIRI
jgi:hypothetical protein